MANLVTRVNGELIEKDAPVVSFRGETWKFLRATGEARSWRNAECQAYVRGTAALEAAEALR